MTELKIAQSEIRPLNEKKKDMRTYMKKRRADNENRDVKERLLVDNFLVLFDKLFPKTEGAGTKRTLFVYCSFSSEAPTDLLIEELKNKGVQVCCPRIENGEMLAVEYGEDFTLSNLGIREPIGEKYQGKIDCIVAPLLAVDGQGKRLGYGGGYYDRFFKKYRKAKRIGYAFDFQIVKEVPAEPWDEPLEWVVTDKQILKTEE